MPVNDELGKHRQNKSNYNFQGCLMKIVKYNNANDIFVEFQDEYKYQTQSTYQCFRLGCIKNPYDKIVFNIGYKGEGKYGCTTTPKIYNTWYSMLSRCYNP